MWASRGWVCGLGASWEGMEWEEEQGEGTPSAAAQTSWSPLVAVLRLRLLLATQILKWPWPYLSSPGLPWCSWSHAFNAVLFICLLTLQHIYSLKGGREWKSGVL